LSSIFSAFLEKPDSKACASILSNQASGVPGEFQTMSGEIQLRLCWGAEISGNSEQIECSRNRSCQSTLKLFRTKAFNSMAATLSIESSYFRSISTNFNKSLKLVRDQVLPLENRVDFCGM
jgi:hypothetical protein